MMMFASDPGPPLLRAILSVLCFLTFFGARTVCFSPPQFVPMACSTLECPTGYTWRWDAASTLCADGACNETVDMDACCVVDAFNSYSWRVAVASNVSEAWELHSVRFFQDDNCSESSLISTAPGVHHHWRGCPNGAAFSHHGGHGAIAAELFQSPPVIWTSGGPCEVGQCFIGFRWESDIARYPLGDGRPRSPPNCASEAHLRKASGVRVACAEVIQADAQGRFAEGLRLQYLDDRVSHAWRTVAEVRGANGGVTQLSVIAVR